MAKASIGCRLVVLISGNGTNLQAIINACAAKTIHANVVGVISNEPDAYGLTRAREVEIPTYVINHRSFNSRREFELTLKQTIDSMDPNLVILAGFMRILGSDLIEYYWGRMLNIHPSLLPNYPGLNTHARVLNDGVKEHGATVHFVALSGDRLLGILAQEIGETGQAEVHFEDALVFCRKAGYRPELAWTCGDYADLLQERDGNRDKEKPSPCWTSPWLSPASWACGR